MNTLDDLKNMYPEQIQELKQEWYIKLYHKLELIISGEMDIQDYLKEIEAKINSNEEFLEQLKAEKPQHFINNNDEELLIK